MTGERTEDGQTSAVVFDLGGVILDFDHMTICRKAASLMGGGVSGGGGGAATPEAAYERIFSSGLEELYDKGLVSTAEFHSRALGLLGIDPAALPMDVFTAIWNDIFTPNDDVIRIIGSLRGRVPLYLLSNTNELHFDYVSRTYPFIAESFDSFFLSYRLGARKPEPEVFDRVITGTGMPPGRLFYVDDSPVHVEAARLSGIDGYLYTSAADLAAALAARGLG